MSNTSDRATEIITNQTIISTKGQSAKNIAVTALVKVFRREKPGSEVVLHSQIIYRNALLFMLFPEVDFAILQVPGIPTGTGKNYDPNILNPFTVNGKTYRLDMASGSRLAKDFTNANQDPDWGSFTFSASLLPAGVGPLYFGLNRQDRWKSIIYGSILHTGCKTLIATDLDYVVTDDTEMIDDLENAIQWDTGDSHGKSSEYLHQLLKISPETLNNPNMDWDDEYFVEQEAVQFRAVISPARYRLSGGRVEVIQPGVPAKGTFAFDIDFEDRRQKLKENTNGAMDADLAIPLSCLKGNKPMNGTGNYKDRILIGTVFESEWRSAKTGWMLFQHFKWETLEADGIVQNIVNESAKLADAYDSVIKLSKLLRIDYADKAENSESFSEEEEEAIQKYEDKFLMIVEADRNGLLLNHPYIVEQLKERLRKRWLTLAKSGGIRFYSFMTMPDDSLAYYNIWDDPVEKNFCIDGRVCCCPDLAEGKYILFVNPMRNWGDVQVWENKHEGKFVSSKFKGIVAAPTALFLTLGRDFDGDFVQMMHCEEYPAMTAAIEAFSQPPKVRKLPKEKLTGDIRMIALQSMSNYAGLVAWLAGITIAHGYSYMPFTVPVGGIYDKEEEMTIIEFLGQELQIAVDSLKSATPNNKAGIDKLMEFYKEKNLAIAWQKGFKDSQVYVSKPCPVDDGATDTISRMVNLVNGMWRQAKIPDNVSPRGFQKTLFKDIPYKAAQYETTKQVVAKYREVMGPALQAKAKDGNTKKLSETLLFLEWVKEKFLAMIDPETGQVYTRESWASAFWFYAHNADTGRAGSVFNFFTPEIIAQLQNQSPIKYNMLLIIGIQYHGWDRDFLLAIASTRNNQNQTLRVRFVVGMAKVLKPKVEIPKSSGNWVHERDAQGNLIYIDKHGSFCQIEFSPGKWLVLGSVAGNYTANLPLVPANGEPSEPMEMKMFLFLPNKKGELYKALLLPANARYELGVAEVKNIVENKATSWTRIYWYIWWLHDSGVPVGDIKARVREWDSPELTRWRLSKNLSLPPSFN